MRVAFACLLIVAGYLSFSTAARSATSTPTPAPTATTIAVVVPTIAPGSSTPVDATVAADPNAPQGADATARSIDLVRTNLVTALSLSGYKVVDPSFADPPQFTVIPVLRFGAVDPDPKKPQMATISLLVRGRDLAPIGAERVYDVTSSGITSASLRVNQIADALQSPIAAQRARIIVINEGTRDSQTAGTSFSGPAYTDARLIAQLLELQYPAVTATEFIGAPSTSTGTVATTVDDLARQICNIDPSVTLLRYRVIYDQTTNPLFSTQNATSTIYARAQRCGAQEENWPAYRETTLTRTFGNQGKIIPLYFGLANFVLSSGRNNQYYRGILGKGGAIATSLLPDAPSTSAEAMAVGFSADRVACQYVNEQLRAKFPDRFDAAVASATLNRRQPIFAKYGTTQDDLRGDPCHAARDIQYQLRLPAATPVVSPAPVPLNLLKTFSH